MREVGLVEVEVVRQDLSRTQNLADLLTFAAMRHRASQLMTIPDADYEAGIRNIRQTLSESTEPPALKSEFVLVTVAGDKP